MSDFLHDLFLILPTCGIVMIGALETFYYNACIDCILNKYSEWKRYLLMCLGVIVFQAVLFSWLPAATNTKMTMLDGLIEFEGGKVIKNLGILCFVQMVCIALGLLRHFWNAIRKRTRFSGKFVLLEIVFIAVFAFAGYHLVENDSTVAFSGNSRFGDLVLLALAALGFCMFVYGIRIGTKEKNQQNAAQTQAPQNGQNAQQKQTAGNAQQPLKASGNNPASPVNANNTENAAERFEKIRAERNRLLSLGDYVSQIPLLEKATSLPLDSVRKAMLWNYLGLAYANTGSGKKSEECYLTALRFNPGNASSMNNLALLYADEKRFQSAVQYMEKAMDAARKSNQPLGMFWGNYAYIVGKKGDKDLAADYLKNASEAGFDEASIRSIRSQIGL